MITFISPYEKSKICEKLYSKPKETFFFICHTQNPKSNSFSLMTKKSKKNKEIKNQ